LSISSLWNALHATERHDECLKALVARQHKFHTIAPWRQNFIDIYGIIRKLKKVN